MQLCLQPSVQIARGELDSLSDASCPHEKILLVHVLPTSTRLEITDLSCNTNSEVSIHVYDGIVSNSSKRHMASVD